MDLVFKKHDLKKIQTPNFIMSPLELKDYIDFEVKRVYFISETEGATSQHCHLEEKEFFIMVKGSAVAIIDQGSGIEEIAMVGPTAALYVGNYVWHGFKDFSQDAILLALSSTNYQADRSDYIEDYEKYKTAITGMLG